MNSPVARRIQSAHAAHVRTLAAATTLKRDDEAVLSLAHARNLLVSREARSVRIWDVNTGTLLKTYAVVARKVAVARELLFVAVLDDTHVIRVYDLVDLDRAPLELAGHQGWISSFFVSPSPLPLALYSTSSDCTARRWLIAPTQRWGVGAIKAATVFSGHTDYINACAGSSDGTSFFTGSCDHTIRKWSAAGHCDLVYSGHEGWIIALHVEGTHLFSASQDGTVREWSSTNTSSNGGACVRVFETRNACLEMRVFASTLYVVDVAQRVYAWDIARQSSSPQAMYVGHTGRITQLDVEPTSLQIFTSSKDGTVRRWAPGKGAETLVFRSHEGPVNCFQRIGERLYTGSQDGSILVWQLGAGDKPLRAGAATASTGAAAAAAAAAPNDANFVRIVVRCQARVRSVAVQRFMSRHMYVFQGSTERYRAARHVVVEESNHVRTVSDAMAFKRAFGTQPGAGMDGSVETMFALLVEIQALHAEQLAHMTRETESSWPFMGAVGAVLVHHFPRLLTLSRNYVAAYHLGAQAVAQSLKRSAARAQMVKEQELLSGGTLESLLEDPFLYFGKQVPLLKTLVHHSHQLPDFSSLLDALTCFQAAAADLTEVLLRLKNRTKLAVVEEMLPGLRVHHEMDRAGVFREGKPILRTGKAKMDGRRPSLVLYLFADVLAFGYPPKHQLRLSSLSLRRAVPEHPLRDAIPLTEARVSNVAPRVVVVERVGHIRLELTFKTAETCREWFAALTHEVDACRHRVFGASLAQIVARDHAPLPWFLAYTCKSIQSSGWDIFDLLLSRVERHRLNEFRNQCNAENPKLDPMTDSGLLMAALLSWLRMLPEPLVPYECCNQFLLHSTNADLLRVAVLNLPAESRDALAAVLQLLIACCRKTSNEDHAAAVLFAAKTFGPVVLRHRQDRDPSALMWITESFSNLSQVTWTLMQHYDAVFKSVPLASVMAAPRPGAAAQKAANHLSLPVQHHNKSAGNVSPRGQVESSPSAAAQADARSMQRMGVSAANMYHTPLGGALSPRAAPATVGRSAGRSPAAARAAVRGPSATVGYAGDHAATSARGSPVARVPAGKPSKAVNADDDDDDDVVILPAGDEPPPLPDSPGRGHGAYVAATPRYQSWLFVSNRRDGRGSATARVHVELRNGAVEVRRNAQSLQADETFDLSRCRMGAAQPSDLQFCIEAPTGAALFTADTVESYVAWVTVLRSAFGTGVRK